MPGQRAHPPALGLDLRPSGPCSPTRARIGLAGLEPVREVVDRRGPVAGQVAARRRGPAPSRGAGLPCVGPGDEGLRPLQRGADHDDAAHGAAARRASRCARCRRWGRRLRRDRSSSGLRAREGALVEAGAHHLHQPVDLRGRQAQLAEPVARRLQRPRRGRAASRRGRGSGTGRGCFASARSGRRPALRLPHGLVRVSVVRALTPSRPLTTSWAWIASAPFAASASVVARDSSSSPCERIRSSRSSRSESSARRRHTA